MNKIQNRPKKSSELQNDLTGYMSIFTPKVKVTKFTVNWYGYTDKFISIESIIRLENNAIDPSIIKYLGTFCNVHRVLLTELNIDRKLWNEAIITMKFMKI